MFPWEDRIFQDDSAHEDDNPIHAAGLIQSWFHEDEVQYLFWPTRFLDLSAIEMLWSILECSAQN